MIEIQDGNGKVLFKPKSGNHSVGKTLEMAVVCRVNLNKAYLRGADLSNTDLSKGLFKGADFRYCYLRDTNFYAADLRDANFRYAVLIGTTFHHAELKGINLEDAMLVSVDLRGFKSEHMSHLPIQFITQCSRDMLFIFQHLKKELPYLRKQLVEGKIDGSKYLGECSCLIGTLAQSKRDYDYDKVNKVCAKIPYYERGSSNMGETWFLSIHEGDKPKDSLFVKHAIKLIDEVLKKNV